MDASRLKSQALVESDLFDAPAVVGRILAVQAQDGRGARLAIRSRLADSVEDPSSSMVDRCLDEGSLVINWLNRGTLHLVRAEDHAWLHALTAPRQVTSNQTRLRQEGVSEAKADRGVKLIVKRLSDGPANRDEIRELLEAGDVPVAGQALVHILFCASLKGLILRGPTADGEHAFVLVDDWLEREGSVDLEAAAGELARRYLAGHGPADERDLAKWAGITLGLARKGFASLGDQGQTAVTGEVRAPARLLGAFDPILHGWESRDWILPDERTGQVVTTNGIFRSTVLVNNRIVGTWTMPRGKIEIAPFEKLDRKSAAALEEEAERVAHYLAA